MLRTSVVDVRRAGGRATVIAIAVTVAACFFAGPATAAEPKCSRGLNDAELGKPLKPAVALTPNTQSAQRQENFSTDRGTKYLKNILLTAEPALPTDVTPNQLNFEALISRTGDNLESIDFPDPSFTQPRISEDRKTITFTICLGAHSVDAGKYVGAITVSGPSGLGPTAVNLTITAKNGGLFWLGGIAALIFCLVLLLLKDAVAHFKGPGDNWLKALKQPVIDMRWWPATLIALGGAFGTLYAGYANDPSWGANGFAAVIILIGTAIAAIGGKSVLSAFAKPGGGNANQNADSETDS